jgi:hypothetical protein
VEVDIASGSSRADAGSGTEWVGTQIVGGSFLAAWEEILFVFRCTTGAVRVRTRSFTKRASLPPKP